jgi:hypothetical protein
LSRLLKVVVSIGLTALAVMAFVFDKYCHDERVYVLYVNPFLHIVTKMNFPLQIILYPILDTLNWMGRFLTAVPGLDWPIAILEAAFLVLIDLFFWYFVLTEIGMRIRGESMLRFKRRSVEMVALAVLFVSGICAIRNAYTEGMQLMNIHGSKIEALLGSLVLVIWGFVLIGMSISDLRLTRQNAGYPQL